VTTAPADYQRRAEARFWPKIDRFGPTPDHAPELGPCWLWTAAKNNNGYGTFTLFLEGQRRKVLPHRWLYELVKGPIPPGLEVDHLCNTRACLRPSHLRPATHRENTLRGNSVSAQMARKTHCKHGHEFTPENTVQEAAGRRCRACRLNRQRAKYHADIEASRAAQRARQNHRKESAA
jgi:hypothetical protein